MPTEWPIRVLELRSVLGTGGGPEKTILQGAAQSDPERFDVTVCYLRDRRDPVFTIDERAKKLGVRYVEVLERHSFDWRVWPQLRRLIRDRRVQIVHAHDYKTDFLALLLARTQGVIPLTTAHGWAGNTPRHRFYFFFDRRLIRHFPIAIAVSERIRQTLIEHGAQPGRVRAIRNGIDSMQFRRSQTLRQELRGRLGAPIAGTWVVGVGRLEQEKRFDVLLEAVAQTDPTTVAGVILAGDGTCRQLLEQRASATDLRGRVHFLGHVTDVRPVYEASDIFAQSSDSEGIPNAVLEAMAMETPAVATDVGGTSELLADGVDGLLVPRRDPGALALALKRTVLDADATQSRVRHARKRVEDELSFGRRTRALESIYEELLRHETPGKR